jgi:hypothetical protein
MGLLASVIADFLFAISAANCCFERLLLSVTG